MSFSCDVFHAEHILATRLYLLLHIYLFVCLYLNYSNFYNFKSLSGLSFPFLTKDFFIVHWSSWPRDQLVPVTAMTHPKMTSRVLSDYVTLPSAAADCQTVSVSVQLDVTGARHGASSPWGARTQAGACLISLSAQRAVSCHTSWHCDTFWHRWQLSGTQVSTFGTTTATVTSSRNLLVCMCVCVCGERVESSGIHGCVQLFNNFTTFKIAEKCF